MIFACKAIRLLVHCAQRKIIYAICATVLLVVVNWIGGQEIKWHFCRQCYRNQFVFSELKDPTTRKPTTQSRKWNPAVYPTQRPVSTPDMNRIPYKGETIYYSYSYSPPFVVSLNLMRTFFYNQHTLLFLSLYLLLHILWVNAVRKKKRKGKSSGTVLWQNPLYQQKYQKSKVTTHKRHKNFDYTTIADQLSDGFVNVSFNLYWLCHAARNAF